MHIIDYFILSLCNCSVHLAVKVLLLYVIEHITNSAFSVYSIVKWIFVFMSHTKSLIIESIVHTSQAFTWNISLGLPSSIANSGLC